jgi:hypothetical protein
LGEDDAAVDSNADEVTASHRLQQHAARTEHENTIVVPVSDDELVDGRARAAAGTAEVVSCCLQLLPRDDRLS